MRNLPVKKANRVEMALRNGRPRPETASHLLLDLMLGKLESEHTFDDIFSPCMILCLAFR